MPHRWIWSILMFASAMLATATAEAESDTGGSGTYAGVSACATSSDCAVAVSKPETVQAMELAKAALDRVVANYQVDPEAIKSLVRGSAGFAVLHDLVKVGFIDAQISGQGFLIYRKKNGRFGPPLMLEVSGTSVGPQIGMRITDVLMVFKTKTSLNELLTGKFLHGVVAPSGSYLYGGPEAANQPTGIVTYSLHRGFMLGQSVDEYHIRLLDQANLRLYGKSLKPGEILDIERVGMRLPLPVQMFVDDVNKEMGEPPKAMNWETGGPMPPPQP
ncbi:MAG: lipid-binding SYLF domain-containing protein [Thiobacillaceae bacterium]